MFIKKIFNIIMICCLLLNLCGCISNPNQDIFAEEIQSDIEYETSGVESGEIESAETEDINADTYFEAQAEVEYKIITPTSVTNIELALYTDEIFCVYDGEHYGYINKDGTEITGFVYDLAYPFSDGLACAMIDGIYGFINTKGEVAIPFSYLDAAPFSEGLAYFAGDEGYGFLNTDGTVAFLLECDSVSSFSEGLAYYSIDGKYGYIDKMGRTVIEPQFSDAAYFTDGLATVQNNGIFTTIDAKGNIVSLTESEKENDISEVESNIDPIIQEIKEQYPYVYENFNGKILVYDEEYYGIVDEELNIIVPVEYDYIQIFDNGSYYLEKEGYFEFYNIDNDLIFTFKEQRYAFITGYDNYYEIKDDDVLTIVDSKGNIVISINYDMEDSVYGSRECSILSYFDDFIPDKIIFRDDCETYDISDVMLQNRITPRLKEYWKLSHGKYVNITTSDETVLEERQYNIWNESNYIKKFRLYELEGADHPLLYCEEEPSFHPNFPLSETAFYMLHNNTLHCLLNGYECGGSSRGDYVGLWKDNKSGKIFLGTKGFAGGFGGYASWGTVCEIDNGVATQTTTFDWIGQTSGNYNEETLLTNAHLFYNDDDKPYTKDNIMQAEYVNEYLVNGLQCSIEEYNNVFEQYSFVNLLK